jgi:FAD/FMN-containing dehydrogenase
VLDTIRAVTAAEDVPDDLTVWVDLLQFPDSPPFVAADVTFLGAEAEARSWLAPFDRIPGVLSDSRGQLPVAALGDITAEPTEPSPGVSRAELLTSLDDGVVEALLAAPIDPLLEVQLRHLGGALARPSDSAAGHLTEPYALYLFGVPGMPAPASQLRARQAELVAALGTHISGRKPQTLLAPDEDAALAYPPATLQRLRRIKGERDPRNVLRSNHPVIPVTETAGRAAPSLEGAHRG